MLAVPALTPVTAPVDEFTVATPVLVLLQVPPLVVLASVVPEPTQTPNVPVIAAGAEQEPVGTVTCAHQVS